MRHYVNVMRLCPVRDLQCLSDASDNAQIDSRVVDQILFNDFPEMPLGRPLFTGGDWHVGLLAQNAISALVLRSHWVLDEERLVWFQLLAELDDMRRVESRMDIQADLDLRPDRLPDGGELLYDHAG